jgi:hypothetical protein
MPVRALAAMLIVAAAGQTRPADTTRVLVRYAVSSEDDSTNAGRVILQLSGSDQKDAVVWEAGCHVAASDGDPSATPSSADQSWWLRVDVRHVGGGNACAGHRRRGDPEPERAQRAHRLRLRPHSHHRVG